MATHTRRTTRSRLCTVFCALVVVSGCAGGSGASSEVDGAERTVSDGAFPIGAACDGTLADVRDIMATHAQAPLTSALRAQLRVALEQPYEVCSQEEYTAFAINELEPWAAQLLDDTE